MPRRKTHEEFIEEVLEKRGKEYQVISEYKGSKEMVWVKHTVCNKKYEVRADGLVGGSKCRVCRYKGATKTQEEYEQDVYKVHGDEYQVVSEYTGALEEVDILHKKCNQVNTVIANSVLQGRRCKGCYNRSRTKTTEEFKQDVYNLVEDEYLVLSEYTLAREPIDFLHNTKECGLPFTATPNSFTSTGNRCPHCFYSKGEDNVKRVLDKLGLEYTREKEFEGLMNIRPLRFDFYIPEYNLLIEYDGEHHFRPVDHFGGEEYLRYIKKNDRKKNRYCVENKINLLRIPYTEINNEEELITNYIENIQIDKLLNRVYLVYMKDFVTI